MRKSSGSACWRRAGLEDLIVLKARTYSEMFSRHQFDRVAIRQRRSIDTTLPDYRDLDATTGW